MRRHALFLVLIAALVIVVALMRPRPVHTERRAAPPAQTHDIPRPVDEVVAEDEPTPPPSPKPTADQRKGQGQKVRVPERECQITVVDVAGEAVPEAVVLILIHPYAQPSSQTKVQEQRTNDAGQTALRMGMHDTADVLAYKDGVGTGESGTIRTQTERTVKLLVGLALDVVCLGVHDVPLEGAEIVLTTDVLFGGQRDAYGSTSLIVVSLPPRKLLTKLDGSGRFGAVFPPAKYKDGWKPTLGIRHRLTADWNRMTAKLTIDKAPEGPVTLYPE